MTETGMLTSNPLDGERRPGTVGVPLPGTGVRVVADDGAPCAAGAIGHIQVRGDNVLAGYWRMPEKTAEEFTADGFFKTGDVGYFGASTPAAGRPDQYLTLVGRSKDLIISGGYNVYPKEIESYIDEMPGVVESAVFGLPHADFGEAVAAVVVAQGAEAPDGAQIAARLKGQIANYKVPKRVWVVTELPRNAMGKVQKNLLRERYAAAFRAS
jgi:malonyl-CoA/methylmalonyl-CoA synthetase